MNSENDIYLKVATVAFIILIVISTMMYLKPRFLSSLLSGGVEPFTTVITDPIAFPKCITRNYDAQDLLRTLYSAKKGMPPASDGAMAYEEFSMILQKLLCMDADITSMGAGVYSTYLLPFNTLHDMEPVGSFVGRCLKNAVRERDIDLTFGKLQARGLQLIMSMCASEESRTLSLAKFDSIVTDVQKRITANCLKEHAPMDHPSGVRDPGYYTPLKLQLIGEFVPSGQSK